ncbi:hypothetical protein [Isoptericola croceus]|uniref:hypothetical protein n=1 Tax=Isoptericola croceus TaxID=3031406 RepID=UPI0023F8A08C|nr:hypothetical protein [Isoptericola croceus]
MNTFTESAHPRSGDGKFATKTVAEADGGTDVVGEPLAGLADQVRARVDDHRVSWSRSMADGSASVVLTHDDGAQRYYTQPGPGQPWSSRDVVRDAAGTHAGWERPVALGPDRDDPDQLAAAITHDIVERPVDAPQVLRET